MLLPHICWPRFVHVAGWLTYSRVLGREELHKLVAPTPRSPCMWEGYRAAPASSLVLGGGPGGCASCILTLPSPCELELPRAQLWDLMSRQSPGCPGVSCECAEVATGRQMLDTQSHSTLTAGTSTGHPTVPRAWW